MSVTWQSKQVLKSGKNYQFPESLKNQPKPEEVSFESWQEKVREFKMNKLIVQDKVPKVSKTKRQDTIKPKR